MNRENKYKSKRKIWKFTVLLATVVIVLTACGKGEETPETTEQNGNTVSANMVKGEDLYHLEIKTLPAADRLGELLPEEAYVTEYEGSFGGVRITDDKIYRMLSAWIPGEEYPEPYGRYLQYIEPPYENWVTVPAGDDEMKLWNSITEDAFDIEDERVANMYMLSNGNQFCANKQADGTVYFGSNNKLWKYEGENIVELMDFREQNLAFKTLEGIRVTEDGFVLLGGAVGHYYLVEAVKTDTPDTLEREKIVLANLYLSDFLKDVVADFNMLSREYEVEIRSLPGEASQTKRQEFISTLQKEMLEGEGPDILESSVLEDVRAYADNGYLMPMTDYFVNLESDLWPVTLEGGTVKGERYGIPYLMLLDFIMGDANKLPQKESWTAEEMMNYVKDCGAKYAYISRWGDSSHFDVLGALLRDAADPTYIDWEKGISHLNEQPFKELLEFVKQYSYGQLTDYNKAGDMLRDGEAALFKANIYGLSDVIFQSVLYDDHPGYIGMPAADGKGVDCYTYYLYVNANCKKKDGVKAFLDYMLSDVGQTNAFTTSYMDALPVRKETFRWMLDTKGEYTNYAKGQLQFMGMTYRMRYLTDKEKEQVIYLVEHAKSYHPDLLAIRGILEEETEPYFTGAKSAEAVMEILHNRIQLYLDER